MGWRDPKAPVTLVVGEIEPFERWTWHLTGDTPLDVEIRLAAATDDRTAVTIAVDAPRSQARSGSPHGGRPPLRPRADRRPGLRAAPSWRLPRISR